jgi:hemoglobin/transferrin/lactoferrin receptor protein
MRAIPISILFFLLSVSTGFGQQVSVFDSDTKFPLAKVRIFVSESEEYLLTNDQGIAEIGKLKGNEKINFQLHGYTLKVVSWSDLEKVNYSLGLELEFLTLDAAVISSNRWRQSQTDIPEKVRRLDNSKLLLRNPSNTADWLGSSGEVFVQKSQLGGGSPMIRGFSTNRLLYSVDGVRMNTAIFRSGNLQNVISLDPFAIENTEIQFGPGSVMYGSDAIGGVMVFETLKPNLNSEGVSGNIITRYSSAYSENTFHGDLSYGSEKLKFTTSATFFDYGDLKMGKSGGQDSYLRHEFVERENGVDLVKSNPDPLRQVGSGYSQLNLMQKVHWKSGKNSTLDYGFHYSSSSDIPRYDRLIERKNGKLRFARWDYGPQIWVMNNLKWTNFNQTRWFDQLKIIAAQQYFEESRIERRLDATKEFNRTENVYAYSLNADFLKTLSEDTHLSYGTEWVTNKVESTGLEYNLINDTSKPASSRYPDSNWTSAAIYGSYHMHLSEKWKFQSALRYNFTEISSDFTNNSTFFPLPFTESQGRHHSLTGNVGFIFLPEPSVTISPLFSTGFRAPNVDDIGKIFDSEPGSVIVPNPDLKPEYAYNAEINLNKHFQNKLKLDLTGFFTYLDKAMVRRPFTLNGKSEILYAGETSKVLAIQNAAFAKVYGIQAGMEFAITNKLIFLTRYNWQKGQEELNDQTQSPSRHAAPAFGLSRLSFQNGKFKVEISSQYSAERSFDQMPEEEKTKTFIYATDQNGNPYSPSWVIFNLNSSYQLVNFLQITVGAENLADLRYRPYSSGIVAPGRNISVTLKASF